MLGLNRLRILELTVQKSQIFIRQMKAQNFVKLQEKSLLFFKTANASLRMHKKEDQPASTARNKVIPSKERL